MTQNPSCEFTRIESDFYKDADALRRELDEQMLSADDAGAPSPFAYLFAANEYQCITASTDRILKGDALLPLMTRIRHWAQDTLGVRHASTPRLMIYVDGCWRRVVQDEVKAKWHYILCLTRQGKGRVGQVDISVKTGPEQPSGFKGDHLQRVRLMFNQMLLHETRWPWGIGDFNPATEPIKGTVFLDGYVW
jgi:hypothetical protein